MRETRGRRLLLVVAVSALGIIIGLVASQGIGKEREFIEAGGKGADWCKYEVQKVRDCLKWTKGEIACTVCPNLFNAGNRKQKCEPSIVVIVPREKPEQQDCVLISRRLDSKCVPCESTRMTR